MRGTIALFGVALFTGHGSPAVEPVPQAASVAQPAASPAADALTLLAAARGADPVLCALAAAPVGNGSRDIGAPRSDVDAGAALLAWAVKPTVRDRDLIALEEGLHGSDECVRLMAARLLAEADGGVGILIEALEGPAAGTRRAAAEGIGHAEAERAAIPLARRLAEDDDPSVRAAAAWALGRIEVHSAEAALGRALRDRESFVRRAAVTALGALELESSIELLVPMLSDADAGTRAAAAHALGRMH